MSRYTEAILTPRELTARMGQELGFSQKEAPYINTLYVRAGPQKAAALMGFLNINFPTMSILQLPASWDEDSHKGRDMSTRDISMRKTIDVVNGPNGSSTRTGWVVNLATDVLQYSKGKILHKPSHLASEAEAIEYLSSLLCSDEELAFTAEASASILAKDPHYPQDMGRGLVMTSQYQIHAAPFFREEVEFYVSGMKSNSAAQVLERHTEGTAPNSEEWALIKRGLTLGELSSTNGGLRWLHPLFDHHITSINGVDISQVDYPRKLNKLHLALLGMPSNIPLLISLLNDSNMWSERSEGDIDKGFYRELKDDWREVIFLTSGDVAVIDSMTMKDIPAASALTTANLLNGVNHSELADEHRTAYAVANTPSAFEQAFRNPKNRLVLTVRSLGGELLGYVLTRESKEDSSVLQIKRIHSKNGRQKGNGIGGTMMSRVIEYARLNGYSEIEVDASGNSAPFFTKHGFQSNGKIPSNNGVFADSHSQPLVTHMKRKLN